MKALETEFDGYMFRSLHEARWAVFYKYLHQAYRYEHQGYDLGGEWYLPDFWFPKLKIWVEIKAEFPTDRERTLAQRLAVVTGDPVFVTFGPIGAPWSPELAEEESGSLAYFPQKIEGEVTAEEDSTYYWAECPRCRSLGLTYAGLADRLTCGCFGIAHVGSESMEGHSTERLKAAYSAARRFRPGIDHGLMEALRKGRDE